MMDYRDYVDLIRPKVANIVTLSIVVIALWYDIFIPNQEMVVESSFFGNSPLAFTFLDIFDPFSLSTGLLMLFLLLLVAVLMSFMNEFFSFITVRTLLPALFLTVTLSLYFNPHGFNVSMILILLMTLILFACFRLCESGGQNAPLRVFNIGMLLGVSSLFSISMFTYVLVFILFFYTIKALSLRTLIAFAMGIFIPWLYALLAYAFTGLEGWGNYFATYGLAGGMPHLCNLSLSAKIFMIVVTGLVIYSIVHVVFFAPQLVIKNRVENTLMSQLVVWTLLLQIVGVTDAHLIFPMTFSIGAFLLGFYFSSNFNLLTKILWGLFAAVSLFFLFFPTIRF